jgi:glutamyl-tRNA synthetase
MPRVRTRFAPSPTGYMHLGNLRTALYAYLIARSMNGTFILRIEDTDQERFVEGSLDVIYSTLRLCGLEYDEGPDKPGGYGPYVQSQRRDTYLAQAKKLIDAGGAYYCFCAKERIDGLRAAREAAHEAFKYDGHCKGIPRDQAEERIKRGEAFVVRQRVPDAGATAFDDIIYGRVEVDNSQLEDGVLLKSDGLPTYNFANVVDDHLMGITHVVRGAEYLSSTPKYNLIYRALGWDIPVLVHLPMIMKDHTRKLGKRYGDPSFEDLLAQGFLTEAVINYIALLGWNPKDNTEFFTLEELKQRFTISGINNAPAIFDIEKLKWMNGEYLRKMTVERFNEVAQPYLRQAVKRAGVDRRKLAALVQQRTVVLNDIPARVDFIDVLPYYDNNLFVNKKAKTDLVNSLEFLKICREELEKVGTWEHEKIQQALFAVIEAKGIKANTFLTPLRIALSGREVTPGGATELAEILGKQETIKRIETGIERLVTSNV